MATFDTITKINYNELPYFLQYFPETVVLYTMDRCIWCDRTLPELQAAVKESQPKHPVLQIIYNKDKSITTKEGVKGFPTTRRYKKDGTYSEHSGPRTKAAFVKFIE